MFESESAYRPLTNLEQSIPSGTIILFPSGEANFASNRQKPGDENGINLTYDEDSLGLVYKNQFVTKDKCDQSIYKSLSMWS